MKLLNICRKCGSVSIALKFYEVKDTAIYSAKCNLCGNETPYFKTEAEAINFWNKNNMSHNYSAKELAQLVQAMRNSQKRYFKTRDRDVLIESKRLEAQVDKYAAEILERPNHE